MLWASYLSGDANPSRLFEGVKFRLAITLSYKYCNTFVYYSTRYLRWYAEERPEMFAKYEYSRTTSLIRPASLPKCGHNILNSILEKVCQNNSLRSYVSRSGPSFFYHNRPVNWIRATTFIPKFQSERDGFKISSQLRKLKFQNSEQRDAFCCVINSTIFLSTGSLFRLLSSYRPRFVAISCQCGYPCC